MIRNVRRISSYTIFFYTQIIVVLTLTLPETIFAETFAERLANAAFERTKHQILYDGQYLAIPYPNGDVPANIGVCTDVVIRSYRALGIDLQKLVHEDIRSHFDDYPSRKIWGLKRPDKNIDHRRVPNLQTFFKRHGKTLSVDSDPSQFHPGDIVTWMLPGNLPHIGIVGAKKDKYTHNPLIIHNIGAGPQLEDVLFAYEITGHYRFEPGASSQ